VNCVVGRRGPIEDGMGALDLLITVGRAREGHREGGMLRTMESGCCHCWDAGMLGWRVGWQSESS
jgi:hypothetical protein